MSLRAWVFGLLIGGAMYLLGAWALHALWTFVAGDWLG